MLNPSKLIPKALAIGYLEEIKWLIENQAIGDKMILERIDEIIKEIKDENTD